MLVCTAKLKSKMVENRNKEWLHPRLKKSLSEKVQQGGSAQLTERLALPDHHFGVTGPRFYQQSILKCDATRPS